MRQSPSGGGGALSELGAAEIKDRPPRAAITASELTRTPKKERCIQPPKRRSEEPLRVRTEGWGFLAGILRVWETPPGGGQTMRTRARHALATGICLVFMGTLGRGQGKPEAEASARHIQPERLWATLQKLGEFGKNPEGGVSRVGFTDADLAGRAYAMGLMREAGLAVRVDAAGNIFGRRAGTEILPADIAERKDDNGEKLSNWLARMGGDATKIATARIAPGSVAGYLELHIEQGAVLDEAKVPIGVVQGIVGISLRTCTATGFANHAGTTPMNRRKDALAAASRAALSVREEVRAEPGKQVGTVGSMKIEPGASNVIPGRVIFPVELRDLDAAKIERLDAGVLRRFEVIGREENVQISCAKADLHAPALTTPA